MKKLHSILRYAKSSRELTEIKQVRIPVARGSMLGTLFVHRVEHPYIVRKLEKSSDIGLRRANCMLPITAANQSACFSFSVANYSQKLYKKHSIRAAMHRIRQFH